jgi:LacI family transcriptional regulator
MEFDLHPPLAFTHPPSQTVLVPTAGAPVATIKDVAREAGVSVATVSRVYNLSPQVSETTRQHVRSVAARMDYWPNGAAQSLITNRTHALGIVLPDLYGEFFSEVIRGIDLAARREHFQVLISSSHADTEGLIAAVRAMRGRIDGLIAMALDADSQDAIRSFAEHFPVVLLNAEPGAGGCGTITIANYEGARAMLAHLIGLGHKRIAMVMGPAGNVDADERLRAYRSAVRESGCDTAPELEIPGDFTEASGYRSAGPILRLEPRPTAVFVANDYMAIGLASALSHEGIEVPGDVALGSFDDIALAQYMNPALTTVRVDAYQLGERAVQRVLPFAGGRRPAADFHEVIPTTLVIRRSCGAKTAGRPALDPGESNPERRRLTSCPQTPAAAPTHPGPHDRENARLTRGYSSRRRPSP